MVKKGPSNYVDYWAYNGLSYFEQAVHSLLNTSFWYPFLEPHQTTYHSNAGVLIRKVTE